MSPDRFAESVVLTERRGRVGIITLNRPAARNAVNGEMARGITAAVDEFEDDDRVWVYVLAGDSAAFCAGGDLKAVMAGRASEIVDDERGFGGLVRARRKKVLIAAVEGVAMGGGFELALACDLIVASRTARFALPEVMQGVMATAGATFRLPRRVPYHLAMELVLTGDAISADRAAAMGIVNRVAPVGEAVECAVELAMLIASRAPVAVRESRALVAAAIAEDPLDWQRTNEAMERVMRSADYREGLTAFVERRQPCWTG